MINKLAIEIYDTAVKKGFYDVLPRNLGEMISLIHGELSEALEADRVDSYTSVNVDDINNLPDDVYKEEFEKNIKDTFEDELADAMIRIMDLAAYKKVDLEGHIKAKMRYNTFRGHKHGKKY